MNTCGNVQPLTEHRGAINAIMDENHLILSASHYNWPDLFFSMGTPGFFPRKRCWGTSRSGVLIQGARLRAFLDRRSCLFYNRDPYWMNVGKRIPFWSSPISPNFNSSKTAHWMVKLPTFTQFPVWPFPKWPRWPQEILAFIQSVLSGQTPAGAKAWRTPRGVGQRAKSRSLPSGELTKSYWKLPFIVDFPIKNGDFPLLC